MDVDLKLNLSDQLNKIIDFNQIINKNQRLIERQAIVERELLKEVNQLKKRVDSSHAEKIAMQCNHDIETDRLQEEIFHLQNQLKVKQIVKSTTNQLAFMRC